MIFFFLQELQFSWVVLLTRCFGNLVLDCTENLRTRGGSTLGTPMQMYLSVWSVQKKIIYPTGLQKHFINDFTFTSLNLAKGGGENLPKLCYVAHSLTVKVAFPTPLGPLPPFSSASLQPEKLIWVRMTWTSLFITSVSTFTLRTVCSKEVLNILNLVSHFSHWVHHLADSMLLMLLVCVCQKGVPFSSLWQLLYYVVQVWGH